MISTVTIWVENMAIVVDSEEKMRPPRVDSEDSPTSHHQSLYLGGLVPLARAACELPDDVAVLWAVGHNPAFSATASSLCGESIGLSTAHAACLEVEADSWEEALDLVGAWTLVEVLNPG